MKKIFCFLVAAVLMMAACGNKTSKASSDTGLLSGDSLTDASVDKHSEAYIRHRIDNIYNSLIHWSVDEDGFENSVFLTNPDSLYCTTRYNVLMAQALEACEQTGDILFDADYWICGQDVSRDFHHQVEKVRDITDSTAVVELKVYNFDNESDIVLTLLYERGDWYIDDFDGENQTYFRQTIKEGLMTREKARSLVGEWGWVGEDCPELLLNLEMTDKGLKTTQCDVYRMYGFEKTTVTFNGERLFVNMADGEELSPENQIHLNLQLDERGDLVGNCTLSHRLASKGYDGPIRLRKGYFMYRDGAQKTLSDYAE